MRLLLKSIWFGTVTLGATIAWFVLYAGVAALVGVSPQSDVSLAITLTTTVFLFVIGIYWFFFRRVKTALLRWTAKTLLILSPFVILCSFTLSTINTILPSSHTPTDTPAQQEATNAGDDSNNAPISPQSGSQTGSSCIWVDIPYGTQYQDSSFYEKGTTHIYAGTNGKKEVCTNSDGSSTERTIVNPSDQIIFMGTRERITVDTPDIPPAQQYQPPSTSHTNPDDCHIADYFCD